MNDVPEGVRGLLTGGIVDVDIFADQPVVYGITDVTGEHHDFELPTDLPLPAALRIMAAYDGFMARIGGDVDAIEEAWVQLLEAFAVVVRIRNDGWTGEKLNASFGQNRMLAWISTVLERLKFQQTQLSLEEYLRRQLVGDQDQDQDPKGESSGSST